MAVATLKRLWKNEYFQTVMMIVLMVVIVFGFWYATRAALSTEYPALAVVSTSMLPTLNVGDIIIVQGVPASQINANYTTGDIVVYRMPSTPEKLIVHRAVDKVLNPDGTWDITTKGDNNARSDSSFHESYLIGRVVARIPYVGNFVLFINALGNFYYFVIVIIIIINILFSIFFDTDEKKETANEESHEKKKLFGKLGIGTIFFIILNVLLIGFTIFSLFGIFTFWQIGADPPQYVAIRGMYADVQYHESFKISYNNVSKAILSQGFLTYKIDCIVNGAIRLGVPTFSWMQASILILVILNLWMANKYFQFAKKLKQAFFKPKAL
jgi:signal peptidase I